MSVRKIDANKTLLQRAELSASEHLAAAGQAVRYLRSRFIVGEARCQCLFEAEFSGGAA